LSAEFTKFGLKLEGLTVQSASLPEELQKVLDQKIGMGMVGDDMAKLMQYQTAQALPKFAEASGSGAGAAVGLGAGVALGQVMAQNLSAGLQNTPVVIQPDEVIATLEKLAQLLGKGVLTQSEFDAKKTELLKKLV
jgi:membrane protease subunit (stomatin/prohibitin family)